MKIHIDLAEYGKELGPELQLGQRVHLTAVVQRMEQERIDVTAYGSKPQTLPGESHAYLVVENLEWEFS